MLKQGWQTLAWNTSIISGISTFNEVLFVFQFWTKSTLPIECTVLLRNLESIDSTGIRRPIDLTVITGIEKPKEIPKSFALSQNYPNPFNPVTKIKFTVPTSSYVNLTIFNSLGQEVKNLVSEEKSAGDYEVSFDASNLTSGIYFYRLKAGSFVEIKKMILMK